MQKLGRDGKTRATTFDCHWESTESWLGMMNLDFFKTFDVFGV